MRILFSFSLHVKKTSSVVLYTIKSNISLLIPIFSRELSTKSFHWTSAAIIKLLKKYLPLKQHKSNIHFAYVCKHQSGINVCNFNTTLEIHINGIERKTTRKWSQNGHTHQKLPWFVENESNVDARKMAVEDTNVLKLIWNVQNSAIVLISATIILRTMIKIDKRLPIRFICYYIFTCYTSFEFSFWVLVL